MQKYGCRKEDFEVGAFEKLNKNREKQEWLLKIDGRLGLLLVWKMLCCATMSFVQLGVLGLF